VLHGRQGAKSSATHSKEPATTMISIRPTPNRRYPLGGASSGSLCSELRSPQRIKTPASANTKKTRQNPNQMFLQTNDKSSIVVNMAVTKNSNPNTVENTIFFNTILSCIIQ
jgi:hypothetical protein